MKSKCEKKTNMHVSGIACRMGALMAWMEEMRRGGEPFGIAWIKQ